MNYPTLEQHLTLWLDPDLAATAAASWEQDMTVKTRAQLDALPDGTAILELDTGSVWETTHHARDWINLPARILSLPNPTPGTTTPETPENPPQGNTAGSNDAPESSLATRIGDMTPEEAIEAAFRWVATRIYPTEEL